MTSGREEDDERVRCKYGGRVEEGVCYYAKRDKGVLTEVANREQRKGRDFRQEAKEN